MPNELLWIVLLLLNFLVVLAAYKFFGKTGLYAWMGVAIILANVQVMKTIRVFGFVTALGNIVYGTTFLVTDILNEKYGKKEARKAVWIGFFALIAMTLVMQVCLLFAPDESDFSSPALNTIFSLMPRIAFASLTAYIVSQLHDVWLFNKLKKKTKGRLLWLRNNVSTMISQFIDNIVFTLIAFWGVFEWSIILQIFITSYVMKWIVAVIDTPIIYLAKRMKD